MSMNVINVNTGLTLLADENSKRIAEIHALNKESDDQQHQITTLRSEFEKISIDFKMQTDDLAKAKQELQELKGKYTNLAKLHSATTDLLTQQVNALGAIVCEFTGKCEQQKVVGEVEDQQHFDNLN